MYKRLLTILLISVCASAYLQASDHLDAPAVMGNGQIDVNDLYAFQSPNPNNTVLVLTVNPFAGTAAQFGTAGIEYQFQIDNNGDATADVTYGATFAGSGSSQMMTLTREGTTIASGMVGSGIATSGGGMVQAGLFDDPFFFDLNGFSNGLMFTGDDAFAGANVSAIVLEIPSADFTSGGNPHVGVWARTLSGGSQVDRVGRPAINTVLIPSARKDEFNQGAPANDLATFGADVNAAIAGLSDQANADALTPVLLPDVLTFDTSSAAGFLNGRGLADDVIDAELTLLTASPTPIGDGVNANDVAFQTVFPYLASANVPEPTGMILSVLGLFGLSGLRKRLR